MRAAIYDPAGKLLLYIDGTEETVALNVPKGGRLKRLADDFDLLSLPGRPAREPPDPEAAP